MRVLWLIVCLMLWVTRGPMDVASAAPTRLTATPLTPVSPPRHIHEGGHVPMPLTVASTPASAPESDNHDRHEAFYWGVHGLLGGITCLLYLQHGRRRRDRSRAVPGAAGMRLVPVTPASGPGEAPLSSKAPAASKEAKAKPTFQAESTRTRLRRTVLRPLPFSLKNYFTIQSHEKVQWSAPYNVPARASGMVTLTNQRLLAVHHQHRLQSKPLRLATETSKEEILVATISKAEILRTHRSWLLLIPAVTIWVHPIGLVLAAVALIVYSAWPRRQLALYAGAARYLYPLPDLDQREILHLLNQQGEVVKAA